MAKGLNEVGAAWRKSNDKGEYFSVSVDLDALAELRAGDVGGKVDINMYPIPFEKTNPRAPDYRLRFYPRDGERPRKPPRAPLPLDDDIPF